MKHPTEIMAPAGDHASLRAAIQGGADSVYFGIEQLNMRAKSSNNFTLEDLPEVTGLCRKNGIKTYLTLNTILYDDDLPVMKQLVDAAKEHKVSAIIASDQAAISYARKRGVKVHISTQANISNIEMVEFYSHFADAVVLARELSLEQVAAIARQIEERQIKGPSGNLVQLEVFAHGALCMAISGKCYLSLHTHNSSANRGACRQNCRQTYSVKSDDNNELLVDNEYIMSPKDLCTIDFLDEVLSARVQILKIEGRGRSPEYVKTVTQCYKEAALSIHQGSYSAEKIEEWKSRLYQVYNRGFWDGYYLGRHLGEWSRKRGSEATRKKIFLGKVLNYYSKAEVAHLLIKNRKLSKDHTVLIIGNTTGVVETEVESLWVNDRSSNEALKGEECTIKVGEKVREGDDAYIWEYKE